MLQIIDVSRARRELSSLMEQVFFREESFIIARRGIPMARLMPVDKFAGKKRGKKKIDTSLFGIWRDKGETTLELAKKLRSKAWER